MILFLHHQQPNLAKDSTDKEGTWRGTSREKQSQVLGDPRVLLEHPRSVAGPRELQGADPSLWLQEAGAEMHPPDVLPRASIRTPLQQTGDSRWPACLSEAPRTLRIPSFSILPTSTAMPSRMESGPGPCPEHLGGRGWLGKKSPHTCPLAKWDHTKAFPLSWGN